MSEINNMQQSQTQNASKPANAIAHAIDKKAALNAIKSKFISTVIKIYVNSLGREVSFREITVAEQKKLSRIMIDNENRKDIVYDAQCAILQSICLEEDLDIYSLTEFDKIKLLLLLYQRNMAKHDITFTCPECHSENKYQIDFGNVIYKLDHFDTSDKTYTYENATWKFDFTISYPSVEKVSKFYKSRYAQMRKISDSKALEALNTSLNIDYVSLFIKSISFAESGSESMTQIDASDYTIDEMFDVISVFPQDVLYSDNGIIQYITKEFIGKINDAFEKHECAICGKLCEDTSDSSAEGFL